MRPFSLGEELDALRDAVRRFAEAETSFDLVSRLTRARNEVFHLHGPLLPRMAPVGNFFRRLECEIISRAYSAATGVGSIA